MAFECDGMDAFAGRAFGGIGCAVAHGRAGLPDDICMAFAREMWLVAVSFTSPSQVAGRGHGMGSVGCVQIEVPGPRNGITRVRVSGQAARVSRGLVWLGRPDLPAARPA